MDFVIKGNTLSVTGHKQGDCLLIFELFKDNTFLDTLILSKIETQYLKEIVQALESNISITTLDLSCNDLGDEGAKVIAQALQENNTLVHLNLKMNNIQEAGAKDLAQALKINSSLTTLNLGSNKIEYEGAKVLGEALRENNSLTVLKLFSNNIGKEGAKEIARSLKENNCLTTLDLNSNKISEGSKDIRNILVDNYSLLVINGVRGCGKLVKRNRERQDNRRFLRTKRASDN